MLEVGKEDTRGKLLGTCGGIFALLKDSCLGTRALSLPCALG